MELDNTTLYELGIELGLDITELIIVPTDQLPLELCERWLCGDDDVLQTSGNPTWISLIRALINIDLDGLADRIEQERK